MTGEQAKFCIYLMAYLAGSRLHSSLVKPMMEAPNGGSISKARTALVVASVFAVIAAHLQGLQGVVEPSSRS